MTFVIFFLVFDNHEMNFAADLNRSEIVMRQMEAHTFQQ
jgi:hypothetical protein